MKKFLSLLLAVVMILGCTLTLSSCFSFLAAKPEMDLEDAMENLEDEDYVVAYDDDSEDPGYEEYLYARSEDDDSLTVVVFSDKKLANMYYDELKAQLKYQKEYIELEIKYTEYMLENYKKEFDSDDIDEMKDELKDLKKQLKKLDEMVVGKKGTTVWYGTESAIEDSKG